LIDAGLADELRWMNFGLSSIPEATKTPRERRGVSVASTQPAGTANFNVKATSVTVVEHHSRKTPEGPAITIPQERKVADTRMWTDLHATSLARKLWKTPLRSSTVQRFIEPQGRHYSLRHRH